MTTIEFKYNSLRTNLDSFGYHQPLTFESVELVENLLNDLSHYKGEYTSYKSLAEKLIQQCNVLEMNQQPLEQKYEKIYKESNYLSLQLIQERDNFQEHLREFKIRISEFESSYSELELANIQQIARIAELEKEILLKNKKLLKYEGTDKNAKGSTSHQSQKSMKKSQSGCIDTEDNVKSLNNICSINNYLSDVLSEKLKVEMAKEFEKCKLEKNKLTNMIQLYKEKISSRDKEIKRLNDKVEKSYIPATNNPVCRCHFLDKDIVLSNESEVENILEESRMRFHLLMEKAIRFAKNIKLLESKAENKYKKSGKIMKNCTLVRCLCEQIQQLQAISQSCFCQVEKMYLSCNTDSIYPAVESKFQKIQENNSDGCQKEYIDFKTREKFKDNYEFHLLAENEMLKQMNIALKDKVISLQGKLSQSSENMSSLKQYNIMLKNSLEAFKHSKTAKEKCEPLLTIVKSPHYELSSLLPGECKKEPTSIEKTKISGENSFSKLECDQDSDYQSLKEIVTKENEKKKNIISGKKLSADMKDEIKSLKSTFEKVKAERDYYCKEYHCLQNRFFQIPTNGFTHNKLSLPKHYSEVEELRNKIKKIEDILQNEWHGNVMNSAQILDLIKNHEIENNWTISKFDELIDHNQILLKENMCLKEQNIKLKDRNCQLEKQNECHKQTNESLVSQVKRYCVLKNKQDHELSCACDKIKALETCKNNLLQTLSEIEVKLKDSEVTKCMLEKERDHLKGKLDEKTVHLARNEKDISQKHLLIETYRNKIREVQDELSKSYALSNAFKKEIDQLKYELEDSKKNCDILTSENKHLLKDIADFSQENNVLKTNIDTSNHEVMKLKQRLQVYVDEVRRVEEILEAKENEREKWLEQFRTLNIEASQLESSNQTLENEKKLVKDSLKIANEKLDNLQVSSTSKESNMNELKQKVMNMECEMVDLKHQISSLESKNLLLHLSLENNKTSELDLAELKEMEKKEKISLVKNLKESNYSSIRNRHIELQECNNEDVESFICDDSNSYSTSL